MGMSQSGPVRRSEQSQDREVLFSEPSVSIFGGRCSGESIAICSPLRLPADQANSRSPPEVSSRKKRFYPNSPFWAQEAMVFPVTGSEPPLRFVKREDLSQDPVSHPQVVS